MIKDDSGEIVELHCSYDADTLGKNPEGRKVRGVVHWVSAEKCHAAEIRLYDPLFMVDFPDASDQDYHELINPESLTIKHGFVEESLASAEVGQPIQFEREGYFCIDRKDSTAENLVFNRTVGLRDTWAKIENRS